MHSSCIRQEWQQQRRTRKSLHPFLILSNSFSYRYYVWWAFMNLQQTERHPAFIITISGILQARRQLIWLGCSSNIILVTALVKWKAALLGFSCFFLWEGDILHIFPLDRKEYHLWQEEAEFASLTPSPSQPQPSRLSDEMSWNPPPTITTAAANKNGGSRADNRDRLAWLKSKCQTSSAKSKSFYWHHLRWSWESLPSGMIDSSKMGMFVTLIERNGNLEYADW